MMRCFTSFKTYLILFGVLENTGVSIFVQFEEIENAWPLAPFPACLTPLGVNTPLRRARFAPLRSARSGTGVWLDQHSSSSSTVCTAMMCLQCQRVRCCTRPSHVTARGHVTTSHVSPQASKAVITCHIQSQKVASDPMPAQLMIVGDRDVI